MYFQRMRFMRLTVIAGLSLSLLLGNSWSGDSQTAALNLDWRNLTVLPENDFYQYANGTWQKKNPIPADYSSWGAFSILQNNTQRKIHDLLIAAAENKQAKQGSVEQKVGDFYFSGMDETLINTVGITPLQPQFSHIDAIKNLTDLQAVIAELHLIGVNVFFGFGSMQDYADSKEMIGVVSQGGLGLPDRDYYLNKNKKFQLIREAYVRHIAAMFELLGDSSANAAKQAQVVLSIETQFAKASMSQTALRDPHAVYNLRDRQQLKLLTPVFSWPDYFANMHQPDIKHINVATLGFFSTMNDLLQQVSLDDWKTYLRWHLVGEYSPYLSKPFVDENFNMVKTLTGSEKLLPRWKRVVNTEEGALGFAIGKLYVDKYFSATAKQDVMDMLQAIRHALENDLEKLAWMTPATRRAALKKLALIEGRVGYPNKWWDYSNLMVDKGPYVLNVLRANQFLTERDINKIGKPVDREEWAMFPQMINAYYDPSMNNINLPAGILQPPFFNPNAPSALNYGAIGFVIGHELTHGFDDQGAQFDGQGNLKNWWTAEDLLKFNKATQCIVDQFSSYVVDGDASVQGKLVVGEATADLGGLTLAYRAFHASDAYKKAKTINGLTPDQQFFLGAAHIWANNMRPAQERNYITTDPHPPMRYRVNGTLANMPEFQAAFKMMDNSPMVNKKRCIIW